MSHIQPGRPMQPPRVTQRLITRPMGVAMTTGGPRVLQGPLRPTLLHRSVSEPQPQYRVQSQSRAQMRQGYSRQCLAMKFRQNWMAKHPMELAVSAPALDDSLTSLNWLHNLNIRLPDSPGTPPTTPPPAPRYTSDMRVNPNAILNLGGVDPITGVTAATSLSQVAPPAEQIDYSTNPSVKPPYSYATLICMAMKASKKQKITLSGIYSWITENFCYFRHADPSWQNSIRHNLSLNKCFSKVPRRKDEPGKGGFWRINPEYEDSFVNGIFKNKRRTPGGAAAAAAHASQSQPVFPPPKKIKKEPVDSDEILDIMTPSPDASSSSSDSQSDGGATHLDGALLKQDINWNSMLSQDIDVDGVRIKTEDLISDRELEQSIDSITGVTSQDDDAQALDDLLNTDLGLELTDMDINNDSLPLDLISGEPLDLTVTGTGLRQPEDWLNNSLTQELLGGRRSGLSTPIAPSPTPRDQDDHPWSLNSDAFDVDIHRLLEVPQDLQSVI